MGSFFRRAAFALRFGDINPLISNFITADSKILVRPRRERTRAGARSVPLLRLRPLSRCRRRQARVDHRRLHDDRPVPLRPASGHGSASSGERPRGSVQLRAQLGEGGRRRLRRLGHLLRRRSRPTRSSGRTRRRSRACSPTARRSPTPLRSHLRYPEDLFRVQTTMWGRYHIEDAAEFYSQSDAWSVAQDPGTVAGVVNTTQTTDAQGRIGPGREQRIDPYYLLMQLPGEDAGQLRAAAYRSCRSPTTTVGRSSSRS